MAIFTWDNSIALGIPSIDEQHKALFAWVNTLNEAVRNGDGTESVREVICKLVNYVSEHFSEEERLMLSCNYPGLQAHRQEHDKFVSRLNEIQDNFTKGQEMSESVLEFMVEWLVCHIKGTDQGYSRFIHQKAENS